MTNTKAFGIWGLALMGLLGASTTAPTMARAADTFATFEQAKDGLFQRIRQDYGTTLGLYSLTATHVGLDGALAADSVVSASGNVVEPIAEDIFRVTDVDYTYTAAQGLVRKFSAHEAPGGVWLSTPTFSAAVGLKRTVSELTNFLGKKHRRFASYEEITLTYTDSQDDRLRWVAKYKRDRFILSDYLETSNTMDWDLTTFFRRATTE